MSFKTETYVPRRYRKFFTAVEFRKGRFPPKYEPVTNTMILPSDLVNNIVNLERIHGVEITPDDILSGRYHVAIPYRDNEKIVFVILDENGNMVGTPISIPVRALEFYAREKTIPPAPQLW